MKKIIIIIAAAIGFFCFMSCQPPGWLVGHDNGEAYDHYQESMKKYINENGLEPDIYGGIRSENEWD